jgi:hypothetical protein
MAEMRDAMFPNCRCNPKMAAVRVSGGAPDEDADAEDVVVDAGDVVVGTWQGR